jgi:hypothetical protein
MRKTMNICNNIVEYYCKHGYGADDKIDEVMDNMRA